MLAGAASSVDVRHTLEPLGHAAMALGFSFTVAGVQESVHVVTILVNGIFYTSDVQPADDHPEELRREREGGTKRREEGDKEREGDRERVERGREGERDRRRTRKTESERQENKGRQREGKRELEHREMRKDRERERECNREHKATSGKM